jgi:hypothetical protein
MLGNMKKKLPQLRQENSNFLFYRSPFPIFFRFGKKQHLSKISKFQKFQVQQAGFKISFQS